MISFTQQALQQMTADATATFPDECCGFFLGQEDDSGNRWVQEVLVVNNAKEGDKKRRFVIAPLDYLQAEQYADEQRLQLLGIYHSHPNHPAIPSEHDRVAAQPYFSYVIISVLNERPDAIRSWRLNDEAQFEEEVVNR